VSRGEDRGDRPRGLAPGVEGAITEAMIQDLVHAFYARARADPGLGPVFNRAVRDWDAHLSRLCDFWSSVILMTGQFKGAPVAVHAQLPDLQAAHFARWLQIFRQTAREVCPSDAAAVFVARAEIIADSLQLGIAGNRAARTTRPGLADGC
jgi:hemoglobin